MLVYDSFTDPQAQPVSVSAFCRVERFEQVGFHVRTHAMAGVSQDDSYAGLTRVGMHRVPLANYDAAAVAGGVKRVAD